MSGFWRNFLERWGVAIRFWWQSNDRFLVLLQFLNAVMYFQWNNNSLILLKALEVSLNDMRYISSRFTYLLYVLFVRWQHYSAKAK